MRNENTNDDLDIFVANTKEKTNNRRGITKIFSFDNDVHKKNFIQTCCVYFNFILLGWVYGQLGTAFPDIQLILDTDVQQTSLIFTMNSIGYMLGSLLIGFVYDRVQHLKLLGLLSILNGVTSCVLPWCKIYGLFMFVRFVDGFLCGGRDGGGNAKVVSCWNIDGRKYLQALHFTYAFGGIISPIVTKFFLAPRINIPAEQVNASINNIFNVTTTNMKFNTSNNILYTTETHPNITGRANASVVHTTELFNLALDNITVRSSVDSETDEIVYGETKVHIAFVLTGALTFMSGCFFIILSLKGYEKIPGYVRESSSNKGTGTSSMSTRLQLSSRQRIVFLLILGASVVVYCTVECKYQSFIMPFVLMRLKWTKSDGAFLVSLLWAFYGIGRFVGIFLSKLIIPQNMLILFLSMLIFASVGTWVAAFWYINWLIWIVIPFAGFSISIIFPTFIVWTNENALKITGKMGGFFNFVGALGFLLDPLYVGALMEYESPMYFTYLSILQSSLAMCFVLIMFCWIRSLKAKSAVSYSIPITRC